MSLLVVSLLLVPTIPFSLRLVLLAVASCDSKEGRLSSSTGWESGGGSSFKALLSCAPLIPLAAGKGSPMFFNFGGLSLMPESSWLVDKIRTFLLPSLVGRGTDPDWHRSNQVIHPQYPHSSYRSHRGWNHSHHNPNVLLVGVHHHALASSITSSSSSTQTGTVQTGKLPFQYKHGM